MLRPSLLALSLLLAPAALAGARHEAVPIGPDLGAAGWSLLTVPGAAPATFTGRDGGVLEVSADDSVAFLYRMIAIGDRDKRRLSWRWRVDKAPAPTDLSRKGADDRPLAVHIWFSEEAPDDGLLGWVGVDRLFGPPQRGKVLTYVWGGTSRRGEIHPNPYLPDDGMIIVLRPGDAPLGQWIDEHIDIAADFERAFGQSADTLAYIAISGDADDTDGASMAAIADIAFGDR